MEAGAASAPAALSARKSAGPDWEPVYLVLYLACIIIIIIIWLHRY